uniref:Uncharacterized protein n=1 Tax=Setaria viridis TaxID=4556 RepID=A0A4U6UHG2_SETVI|nr:LOW QUALITY PROTEIN: hypothetical protein SEVIR_5G147400v2 [Setaria viridis]
MADLLSVGGMRKLNSHNYTNLHRVLGQYLWEVVAGIEKTPSPKENAEALRTWRIKEGKAMFTLKTTIEEDLDCRNPWRHSEGNVATTKEDVLSTCLSEEEWDAEAATTIEDDGAYFVEDLIEWDAEGGFSMKVRDPDTSEGFVVFGYDSDEDWEALSDNEEDIKNEKIEPSLHDDRKPQEHSEDEDGALVIYEDLKTRCGEEASRRM